MSRILEKRIGCLEQQCGQRKKIVALHNGSEYIIPSENRRRLNEAEFQRWQRGLGPHIQLFVVRTWFPEVTAL